MSLFPTVFKSTDPGAPALTGQAGSMAALLDALLVDGYGVGVDTRPGLGWTREFSAVNTRAYRNNLVTGTGYFLRIDDSNALFTWMRGYEQMTDIDTGARPVPTLAQRANGSLWIKSSAAGAVARPWFAIGNERCFYLFIQHSGTSADFDVAYFAGDIVSYVPSDQHCFALSQNGLTTYSSGFGASQLFLPLSNNWDTAPTASSASLYIGRNYAGAEGAVMLGPINAANIGLPIVYGGSIGNAYYDIPAPVNGGVISVAGILQEAKFRLRGEYPGLRAPISTLAYGNLQQMEGRLLSKRFRIAQSNSQYVGEVIFELDREWT
ncbi:hypothetical protein SN15_14785 [Stenotrophomonas maltophilia]|nr:hypothetical protein SN15_14785 [Stenotrophomonas maltophilia]